ncbi:unnamed protein product [Pylaiella littoralis]
MWTGMRTVTSFSTQPVKESILLRSRHGLSLLPQKHAGGWLQVPAMPLSTDVERTKRGDMWRAFARAECSQPFVRCVRRGYTGVEDGRSCQPWKREGARRRPPPRRRQHP